MGRKVQVRFEIGLSAVRSVAVESVAAVDEPNAWVAFHQDELRRRYGMLLAQRLQPGQPLDERSASQLVRLSADFYGALGIAEGLMANRQAFSAGAVADALERARERMPSDAAKVHQSRFFYLRGALRLDLGDRSGAIRDFETALAVWPAKDNRAATALKDLYQGR